MVSGELRLQRVTTSRVMRPVERDHHLAFFGSSPLRLLGLATLPNGIAEPYPSASDSLRHIHPGRQDAAEAGERPLGDRLVGDATFSLHPVTACYSRYSLLTGSTPRWREVSYFTVSHSTGRACMYLTI